MQQVVIQVPNAPPAKKVATLAKGQKLHLRMLNGAANDFVRFANSRELLDSPSPFLPLAGNRIYFADLMIEVEWDGDVWLEGVAANTVVVQILVGVE